LGGGSPVWPGGGGNLGGGGAGWRSCGSHRGCRAGGRRQAGRAQHPGSRVHTRGPWAARARQTAAHPHSSGDPSPGAQPQPSWLHARGGPGCQSASLGGAAWAGTAAGAQVKHWLGPRGPEQAGCGEPSLLWRPQQGRRAGQGLCDPGLRKAG
jgi:hypothetical protein